MSHFTPHTYQELLAQASHYENKQALPPLTNLLQNFGVEPYGMPTQAPLFYVLDYVNKRYLHIAPSVATILGYSNQQLLESGPTFYMKLWHPEDFSIYSNHIVPATLNYLKEKINPVDKLYAISHNHRIKNTFGNWLMFLQRSTYIWSATGEVVGAYGFSIDITHYKESSSIVHTIERIDTHLNSIDKEPCYKRVYPTNMVFSLRELEVLNAIYGGFSSKQIAEKLSISIYTVHNHRKNMLTKSGCVNSAELIQYAVRNGLL
ncbi:MAG: response regulator transcription factor [Cyclobacteriaceae bacterium]|nr:response regulator transcription factor [Cyclobacteriaceae bacterium]